MKTDANAKVFLATLALFGSTPTVAQTLISSRFETDRVYVQLETDRGEAIELYTDTGGGGLVISAAAAARLGLRVSPSAADPTAGSAASPKLRSSLPPLPPEAHVMVASAQIPGWPPQADGFLGAPWFSGGIWTWDYPGHQLLKQARWNPPPGSRLLPIYFQTESDGTRTTGFARIMVTIDGEPTPMLLDTGAETFLTEEATALLGGDRLRATSMIAASLFDKWKNSHSDWPFVAEAQEVTHADMIEVPDVQLAGLQVGPLWFTRRPDANFHKFMSSMTDSRVEGALGGNAFRSLVMTVDFPGARAAFALTARARHRNHRSPAVIDWRGIRV